jgi:hypothetical protein
MNPEALKLANKEYVLNGDNGASELENWKRAQSKLMTSYNVKDPVVNQALGYIESEILKKTKFNNF